MKRSLKTWCLLAIPVALIASSCSSSSGSSPKSTGGSSASPSSSSSLVSPDASGAASGSGSSSSSAPGGGGASGAPATPVPINTQPAAVQPPYNVRELIAAARETFPGHETCDNFGGDSFRCPFTPRLRAYLQKSRKTICRCVNPSVFVGPEKITAEVTASGGVAHVSMGVKYDLLFATSGNLYVIDDEYCTGQGPPSSIYVSNRPC